MKCTIHVYLLNENFSSEHADAHYGGEESENNLKYEWEDEFAITSDVQEVLLHEKTVFPLVGEMPDGTPFHHEIEDMFLFEIRSSDAPTAFVGASSSIVESHEVINEENEITLRLYIKDYEPMANPIPGVYIASKEFPKALIF